KYPNMIEEARAFLSKYPHIPLFPLNIEKQPIKDGGFKVATNDWDTLQRLLYSARGGALLGVPTGEASGVMVTDIALPPEWEKKILKRHPDGTPDCPGWNWYLQNKLRLGNPIKVTTRSGGLHLYYAYANSVRNSEGNTKGIAEGVDVRGEGGYVV